MIKQLKIKNYQSWENLTLNFCSGINIITGYSTKGKTSIKRALDKLVFNRPSGARFYSNFAPKKGETNIEIILNNDDNISLTIPVYRDKNGKKKSKPPVYALNKKTFQPGVSIPDKIVDVLNLTELNFLDQHDPPFLVNSTGGQIAKEINKITNLSDVDLWQAKLTKRINKQNTEIKIKQAELKDKKNKLKKFKNLSKIKLKLKKLKKIENNIKTNEKKINEIEGIMYQLSIIDSDIKRLKNINNIDNKIIELQEINENILEKEKKLNTIIKYISIINLSNKLKNKIKPIKELIVKLEKIIFESEEKTNKISLIKLYKLICENLNEINLKLIALKDKIIKELKKQKTCPTCFSDINNKKINLIIKKTFN